MNDKPTLVFNAGIYDLMHEGHLILLRRMRERADKLVIVVHDDASCFEIKDKTPIQDIYHRIRNLTISKIPNEIYPVYMADPGDVFAKIILKYRDDYNLVYMRGDDRTDDFPGRHVLEKHKIPIEFLPYTEGVSSSKVKDILCRSH